MGALTPEQAQSSIQEARLAREALGQYLLRRKLVTPQDLCKALSLQCNLPIVIFQDANIPVAAKYVKLLSSMAGLELVPFMETDQEVHVAVKRPPMLSRMAEIERAFRKKVRLCLAQDEQIAAILSRLFSAGPAQRRRHTRYRMTMPVWLQLCNERNQPHGTMYGGQILDLSLGGLKVEAPAAMVLRATEPGSSEPLVFVRFSAPPREVRATCVVRYVQRKGKSEHSEDQRIVGLEFNTLGADEREHLKLLQQRGDISSSRLEMELGVGNLE